MEKRSNAPPGALFRKRSRRRRQQSAVVRNVSRGDRASDRSKTIYNDRKRRRARPVSHGRLPARYKYISYPIIPPSRLRVRWPVNDARVRATG